jgi:hypothetical protein
VLLFACACSVRFMLFIINKNSSPLLFDYKKIAVWVQQHHQLNTTINQNKVKQTVLYCAHNRQCGTKVTWVGLCNGKRVDKCIGMKCEIILVMEMIIIATVSTSI